MGLSNPPRRTAFTVNGYSVLLAAATVSSFGSTVTEKPGSSATERAKVGEAAVMVSWPTFVSPRATRLTSAAAASGSTFSFTDTSDAPLGIFAGSAVTPPGRSGSLMSISPEASGEIDIKLPDLPGGVTAEPAKIPSGASEVSVKLKVDPDAAAADVNLVARGETKVGQETISAASPTFALSVTELPGFSVTVEPKELTVAAASKTEYPFTVKAVRRGGFDSPIDLQWRFPSARLILPAGRIDAGKSEAR